MALRITRRRTYPLTLVAGYDAVRLSGTSTAPPVLGHDAHGVALVSTLDTVFLCRSAPPPWPIAVREQVGLVDGVDTPCMTTA